MFKKSVAFFAALLILSTSSLALEAESLIPIGHTTGIKMHADGVVVIGTAEIPTKNGYAHPGEGVEAGDVITKVDGKEIKNSKDFQSQIRKNGGRKTELTIIKKGKEERVSLTPIKDAEGEYKLGLWVRDSMAGIGTITFYDAKSNTFGALGHGICDAESGVLIPFKEGQVMESVVEDVKKGVEGEPGELHGNYNLSENYGVLLSNTEAGIFGKVDSKKDFFKRPKMAVAKKDEIKCGPATILTNVAGDNVEEYKIEIVKIFPSNEKDTKNMMIKVTDEKLIEKTGGIVQGMSGSPIIQDGKLVGAVTHVLVNDPTRGYGIFIENMLEAAG